MRQAQLTECPVCHSALVGAEKTCASCTADLQPYRDLLAQANALMLEAYNAVLRGESGNARELGKRALEVSPLLSTQYPLLLARAALVERRHGEALQHALALPEGCEYRSEILEEAFLLQEAEVRGKEHYNLALTSARKGQWADASYHASRAMELAPYEEAAWRLAVKVALRGGRFAEAESLLAEAALRFPGEQYISKLAAELSSAR